MMIKSLRPSRQPSSSQLLMILALFTITLILLLPSGGMLADSNAPTVTNTSEPTDTPVPEQPTEAPAGATNTPILLVPTVDKNDQDTIMVVAPSPDPPGRFSTIDRILLVILAVVIVLVVGVIVFIFINQTRGGSDDHY